VIGFLALLFICDLLRRLFWGSVIELFRVIVKSFIAKRLPIYVKQTIGRQARRLKKKPLALTH
jgi:hypothetical protein